MEVQINCRSRNHNYGSISGSQEVPIGSIRTESVSSWVSSYSRAMTFQYFRDGPQSIQGLDNEANESDFDSPDVFEGDYHRTHIPDVIMEVPDEEEFVEVIDESEVLLKAVFVPKSNFSQTLFNSVNILMGVGLLSLPFAFNITGWVVGFGLLLLFGLITHHTAQTLKHCLDYETTQGKYCNSFGDLGELAFGPIGRTSINLIFFFELCAACIALIILSADSIVALFPSFDLTLVKIVVVVLIFPLTIPKSLAIASYGSIVGILAVCNLMAILIYDGLSIKSSPGSIIESADTSIMPIEWYPVPFTFGLLMAGFSGHSVFPNLYRDMIQPKRYHSLVNWTYFVILISYGAIASIGYLMFGSSIREEITQNLPLIPAFNPILTKLTVALVAINPITKFPLNMNPINFYLDNIVQDVAPNVNGTISRLIVCSISAITLLFFSIIFPGFHSMMALLGSFFSFTVSVVFPTCCYMILYGHNMSVGEWILESIIALIGGSRAIVGTVWVFLP